MGQLTLAPIERQKVVSVKGTKRPSFVFGSSNTLIQFRVSYIQIAYDNRYVVVEHKGGNTGGWSTLIQTSDNGLAAVMIQNLIDTYVPAKLRAAANTRLSKFWVNVTAYDKALDDDDSAG